MPGLYQKICSLIKRGSISLTMADAGNFARAQVGFMGKTKVVELVVPYGLASRAPAGSCVLLLNINGQEENMAGISYAPLSRFKNLADGEVVVGNPVTESYVKFSADGKITVVSQAAVDITASGAISITSTAAVTLTCTDCNITASGNIALGAGGLAVARVGDAVAVDPGTHTGTITAGSTKVKSV